MKGLWLVALLAACAPSAPLCSPSASTPVPREPLLVPARTPHTASFVFGGVPCRVPDEALSVRPLLTTPSGALLPVEGRFTRVLRPSEMAGTVEVELSLPALEPGTHTLQLFVEPAIAVMQLPINVLNDRRDAGFLVRFAEACLQPARTTSGTQFCTTRSGSITASRDGQSSTIADAGRVMTAGGVAWVIGSATVSRYEDRANEGLVLTGSAQLALPGAGSVDASRAVIGNSLYEFDGDAGVLAQRTIRDDFAVRWLEGERIIIATPGVLCDDEDLCVSREIGDRFLALDVTYAWFTRARGTSVALMKRPVSPDAGDVFAFPMLAGLQPLSGTTVDLSGGLPALLRSKPDAGQPRLVLLQHGPQGTTFDLIDPRLAGQSRDFLFVESAAPNELRVIPLPLAP
ncbi:MAG: hypothetical protein Q8N26_14805 [Myxococcales bacterium]|nr:hypothetical protein [Myxococcales bacterium]